jgi:hypothetical protein
MLAYSSLQEGCKQKCVPISDSSLALVPKTAGIDRVEVSAKMGRGHCKTDSAMVNRFDWSCYAIKTRSQELEGLGVEWRKRLVVLRVFDGALKGSAKTQAKALRAFATLEHNGLGDNEDLVERADSMTKAKIPVRFIFGIW